MHELRSRRASLVLTAEHCKDFEICFILLRVRTLINLHISRKKSTAFRAGFPTRASLRIWVNYKSRKFQNIANCCWELWDKPFTIQKGNWRRRSSSYYIHRINLQWVQRIERVLYNYFVKMFFPPMKVTVNKMIVSNIEF